jgi:penicillin-binding protein 2
MGEVGRKEIEKDDYYVSGDYFGKTGIERSYETTLRGSKGNEILLRDPHGRIKGRYEEGKHDVAPVSGKNITLSIDMNLQAFGEKLLQNKLGAIVMIEPATGEILCAVTSPSYDPNLLIGRQRTENYNTLNRDPQLPLYDRSVQARYSPGSTFKPAQALVFLQEGVITKDKTYTCIGGYPYLGGSPKCHGHYSPLSLVFSLATSCNAYYCWGLHDMLDNRSNYGTVQEALEAWRNRLVSMGFGEQLGVDLPGENSGFIPGSRFFDNNRNKRWNSSSIISIAIGQAEIGASPMQICNLAATIANRGYYVVPHVVREIQDMPLEEKYRTKKYTGIDEE